MGGTTKAAPSLSKGGLDRVAGLAGTLKSACGDLGVAPNAYPLLLLPAIPSSISLSAFASPTAAASASLLK